MSDTNNNNPIVGTNNTVIDSYNELEPDYAAQIVGANRTAPSAVAQARYTSMTTDKRFTLLDSAEWDLRDNHAVKITIDDDDEDEEDEEELEDEIEDEIEDEEDLEEPIDDEELDVDTDDDDLEDLSIINEEDIEE